MKFDTSLRTQADAWQQLVDLMRVQALLNIMSENLQTLESPNIIKTLFVGSGNLFQIAAQEYGDALQWKVIAEANGLTDPWITDFINLVIPALSGQSR